MRASALFVSTAVLAALGAPVQAQDAAQAVATIDELVITGERFGAGLSRATFALSAEDIEQRPLGADITLALEKIPGVQVSTGDARGGSFSFELYMRGLTDGRSA